MAQVNFMPSSLRRELTLVSAAVLIVSNMVGTGIFTTTGFLAGDLGRPALVLGIWVAGAVVALAGCLSYAELGINLPRSGGEYVYLREAWGPAWGFLSGWVSFFAGFAAPIAAGALAFSGYFGRFLPSLALDSQQSPFFRWLKIDNAHLLSAGVIALFALINALGLRLAARIQNVLTAVKVAALGAFLVLAVTIGRGSWAHFHLDATRTSPHGVGVQFAVSLVFVTFAYSGWNAANYVAEELKVPEHTLPRVMILGTVFVALLYLALNVAFVYALPLESLKGVVTVGAAAAGALFGARAGALFSGILAAGLLAAVSAMSLVGPRVYYAMAQDGCFPRSAARVHPRWQTPYRAIAYQAVASIAMVLTGTFESLVYYIGFALILFAALAVAGLLRLRKRTQWRRLRAVSWCYPAVPVAFILASLWMLTWTLVVRPRESALGVLTVGCGWLWYRWKFGARRYFPDAGPRA
jgi:basic amino acid/polyamine antiporter, APA family